MALDQKIYRTILIDPPWEEKGAGNRGADKHYNVLKTYEIVRTIVNCPLFNPAPDSHLYLWATNNFLEDGFHVLNRLGYRYITNIVWVKPTFGLGFYFRGQHEICLFGAKGDLKPRCKDFEKHYTQKRWSGTEQKKGWKVPTTVIHARKRGHSTKPYELYDLIEVVSYPPRLEMFARTKREGWDAWGLEVPNTTQSLLGECNCP